MSFIKELLKAKSSDQTIFTFSDLNNIIPGYSGTKLKSALKYAVKKTILLEYQEVFTRCQKIIQDRNSVINIDHLPILASTLYSLNPELCFNPTLRFT